MDRLVCGDVGYGKTEVAVRAAFKAVQDGKQVAVLVPTTLLAQQHHDVRRALRRLPGARRGAVRFLTDKEARRSSRARDGEVDVVIGTHRLLSARRQFKDLGLLVVDEEQRFGVEHKEQIKQLRTNVDVLTLATPIPRTLEMALTGIREMSLIDTPPEERHPILTYVGEYDDRSRSPRRSARAAARGPGLLRPQPGADDREGRRARLRELVPEARVAVAHGQMDEHQLEQVDARLLGGRVRRARLHDDHRVRPRHPNANTLIVERADLLGLGQLHQLRGRVGRGRRAGLRLPPLPAGEAADRDRHERLKTIGEHTELGGGIQDRDARPRDPRRRQPARRRAVRPHRRRRLRPLRPAGRRGGRRVQGRVETGRLDTAAGTAARLLFIAPDPRVRAEVESALGVMLQRVGRVVEARDHFLFAASLADGNGLRASYLAQASEVQFLAGDLPAARTTANEALVLGERSGNAAAVCEALGNLAFVAQAEGDPGRALDLARRSHRLGAVSPQAVAAGSWERSDRRDPRSGGLRPLPVLPLAAALVDLDRLVDAETALGDAIQVCRLAGAEPALPLLLAFRSVVRLLGGDWAGAEHDCRDLVSLGESTAHRIASPVGWGVGALVAASRGDLVSARQFLGEAGTHRLSPLGPYGEEWVLLGRAVTAVDFAEGQRHLVGAWYCSRQRPWFLLWRVLAPTLVRSSLRLGDRVLAEDVATQAAGGAALADVAGARACADQCAGLVHDDVELLVRAREGYAEARRPYWQAKADVDLARAWMDRGDATRAVPILREATDVFHDLGATRTAAQAGVLLAHAAGSRPPRQREPHPLERLTRAERLVAVRAGRGRTNPQIADELALSTRTVQAHLSNIYAKLAIGSRVQLAAVLAPHDLGAGEEPPPAGFSVGHLADAVVD
jgi:DNA-binding NarL/FixJ family response regulator